VAAVFQQHPGEGGCQDKNKAHHIHLLIEQELSGKQEVADKYHNEQITSGADLQQFQAHHGGHQGDGGLAAEQYWMIHDYICHPRQGQ